MISIKDLKASDISFVLGIWHSVMGGTRARHLSRTEADEWLVELERGGQFRPKAMDSRWHQHCDLTLAVDHMGKMYAICYSFADNFTANDEEARIAGTVFELTVGQLE